MQLDITDLDFEELLKPLEELRNCKMCPRACGADRFSDKPGYCKTSTKFSISSICIHKGEEPPVSGSKGICNVFFTNCNLQCSFCQNYQISDNKINHRVDEKPLSRVLNEIIEILDQGIPILGFVSPSHFIPHLKIIIEALNQLDYHPTIVYNSNGYDAVDELKKLEGKVDVYLPDLKYMDNVLGQKYSDVKDYVEVATKAIKEMYRQMGANLIIDDNYIKRGLLIRHLVLPGAIQNSKDVLRWIADHLSEKSYISLMSQYYPSSRVCTDYDLGRTLKPKEYEEVYKAFKESGLSNGWIQELASQENYRPDFYKKHPFE